MVLIAHLKVSLLSFSIVIAQNVIIIILWCFILTAATAFNIQMDVLVVDEFAVIVVVEMVHVKVERLEWIVVGCFVTIQITSGRMTDGP